MRRALRRERTAAGIAGEEQRQHDSEAAGAREEKRRDPASRPCPHFAVKADREGDDETVEAEEKGVDQRLVRRAGFDEFADRVRDGRVAGAKRAAQRVGGDEAQGGDDTAEPGGPERHGARICAVARHGEDNATGRAPAT